MPTLADLRSVSADLDEIDDILARLDGTEVDDVELDDDLDDGTVAADDRPEDPEGPDDQDPLLAIR